MDSPEKKPHIILRIIDGFDGFITGLIMIVIFVDVVLQITTRILPIRAFAWTNELGEIMLSCLIWIGLSAAVKTNNHIGFDLFVGRLSPKGKKWMGFINMGLFASYLAILGYLTWGMMQLYLRRISNTPILGISMYWVRMPILVGCAMGFVRLLIKEYRIATDKERMYETSILME